MSLSTFQWLTGADVTLQEDGLLLADNNETLQIDPELIKTVKIEFQDVSTSTKTQDSENPKLRRILIRTNTPANRNGKFIIRAIPGSVDKK